MATPPKVRPARAMNAVPNPAETPTSVPKVAPRVWFVLSDKIGDNAQVQPVEKALPWVCEHKVVRMREPYVLGKPKVGASLHHIDLDRSDPLEPPWPDLVITIGRRPSMVAMWIRERSGGRTKIVLFGKPSARIETFDLIVHSGENQLPPLPNVMPIGLPLMQVDEDAIASSVASWRARFADLPRPLVAFLVGGPTDPFVFESSAVDRLLKEVTDVLESGGTPYITTSRRTPTPVVDGLEARLPDGAKLFAWKADASENPYQALLGLADAFVVTGDSVSMIVEVVRMRRPLAIFPLPTGWLGGLEQARQSLIRWLFAPATGGRDQLRRGLAKTLYRLGIARPTRDFRAFHQRLIDGGLARWVGDGLGPPRGQIPDDLPRVAACIEQLMAG